MIMNKYCEVCRLNNECGYISRNLEEKCPDEQLYQDGYYDGYDEALSNSINAVYKWIKDNYNIDDEILGSFIDYIVKQCEIK